MTFINFDQANVFGKAYIDNDTEAQKKVMQAKREDVKQYKGNYFSDIKKDLKTGVKWTSQKKQCEKMVNVAKFSQDKIYDNYHGTTTTSRENTVDPNNHDANHVDYWKSIESTKSRRVNYNSSFAKQIQKKSNFKPKPIPEGYAEHGVDINHGFDNTLQQNAKQPHNGMDISLANLTMNNIQDQDDSNGLSSDSPMF